jgi:hypothetical protein
MPAVSYVHSRIPAGSYCSFPGPPCLSTGMPLALRRGTPARLRSGARNADAREAPCPCPRDPLPFPTGPPGLPAGMPRPSRRDGRALAPGSPGRGAGIPLA